ncbi:MAG: beta-propeller fold lactonase family protein, partial [Propionicimonas sp.]|nr:beta-propeller fold lactonase family protein [Propionicimonas sp.]
MSTWDLLIGGYTDLLLESAATASGPPAAVRWASLDDAGRLVDRGRLDCGTNPSWLTLHPELPVAYACGEDFAPGTTGSVTAWYLGGDTPTLLGTGSSGGHAPCHALVVPDGDRQALVLSHYVGGQVSVVPLDFDGRPSATASDVVAHAGASLVKPERQEAAHPHQAMFDPVGELVWVSDLGQDRVVAYRVRAGRLTEVGSLATAPGFGPRHAALHPQGDHLALVGELANEVVLYRRGATATTWQQTDSSSTLPAGWPAANTAAARGGSP